MLILSRKVDEALRIGDDITVTVLSVKGNQVRLGIKAPKDVTVHREEVALRGSRASEVEDDDGASQSPAQQQEISAPDPTPRSREPGAGEQDPHV